LTGGERGYLLLTSTLGDPERKPLSMAQFRELTSRVNAMTSREISRDVDVRDFTSIGYAEAFAQHIVALLRDEELLEYYLLQAKKASCFPITRASKCYPVAVRKRLGMDSPGTLWAKGDISFLDMPKVALVGSRDLQSDNASFAKEVGRQAAQQGYVLISGNARGADKLAQSACLEYGGRVISVVADSLLEHTGKDRVLYLSENSFADPFSAQRAISRNRVIHSLGAMTFVAQSGLRQGGTWDGAEKNLRYGWSPVYCYADESLAQQALVDMGAQAVTLEQLHDFSALPKPAADLFTMEE
jgi:predicted Rossmann fold nucleotide-binding protein DprA/Smf involved in DNA uptake